MTPRVFPFALYFAFLGVEAAIPWLAEHLSSVSRWSDLAVLSIYPIKTVAVLGAIIYFWPRYEELRGKPFGSGAEVGLSIAVGVLVYLAWVRMDWSWAMQGEVNGGYDPFTAGAQAGLLLAGVRMFGASIVVPIMEELFWRSFLIRYLVSPHFQYVRIGVFAPVSFVGTVILFGLEHNLWLAGMMAGVAYNLLLYRTGRLWPCILAHGVTNAVLAIHVLVTGEVQWW